MPIPLSVLDLVPISAGDDSRGALQKTLDLAQHAEAAGYRRYWLAEHHLNPGVAGSSTALLIALVAGATDRIRVGSGAVQLSHRTPLSVLEDFGTLDAAFPGRIDLGLGRSGARKRDAEAEAAAPASETPAAIASASGTEATTAGRRTANGLLLPPPFSFLHLLSSPRFAAQFKLLYPEGAQPGDYTRQVTDLLALLAGEYRSENGVEAHVVPGEGADLEVWILGSSPGESAQVAGARGLPFAANYHVSPSSVVDAVEAYRAAFRPSDRLSEPYVVVSADVVVGPDDESARWLASPYGLWVRSIRSGEGAIPFPTPEDAALHAWTEEDRALVRDRIDTQFVGSPATVAAQLRILQEATGADELLITTITHGHSDRVRSYELLAKEWLG
ncbi:LLM class flavin-dependent oxidoreductase [Cryptosporangium aurantiacum]|uniref:Luciferase family oxidoreductase, group 1 n=1 Tax=Cryptosporangium aurantiacum TaxID=134849 RepID=A0A1M7QY67_9ACTN|nr:LLM class flavin-dependent oxidoreductase [Cryptosporangium aurantiacum]SHN37003.1 luciferase family oxidoreductase, group 1 [Cryptosporangium aurantiacum]